MRIRIYIQYADQYDGYKTHCHYAILDTDSVQDREILNAIYDGDEDKALDMIGWGERDMRITRIALN